MTDSKNSPSQRARATFVEGYTHTFPTVTREFDDIFNDKPLTHETLDHFRNTGRPANKEE